MIKIIIITSGVILLMVLALVIALSFRTGKEIVNLDANARATMKNESFVELSDGITHYQWQGPERGRKVLLVHGYSSPYFIWDRNLSALTQAGFRVLRFDLYGRGLSDRLQIEYTGDVFDRQLLELLDALNVKEPVDLVGLSMGGAIATLFTDRHPERVRKLVLIGTAGVSELPMAMKLLSVPLAGDLIIGAFGDFIVTDVMPREVALDSAGLTSARAAYANQLQYRGYKRALSSTLRHGPLTGQEAAFSRVGLQKREGMLLWGTRDKVVPYEANKRVKQLIPWLDFHPVNGGRHCVNYENADEVNAVLVAFLAK